VCGCAPFAKKEVQNAGHAFFEAYERQAGDGTEDSADGDAQSPLAGDSPSGKKKRKEKKEREDALKLPDSLKGEDLYALLELDAGASQDDLKKAYRKMCLVHHPDKQGSNTLTAEEKEKLNARFVKLQEAFEVLNDPKKRRKYDSIGDFDDSVPSGLRDGQDFFEVFGPVFKRNARWSEHKPVPDLGGPETPHTEVVAFYDWWREFESWRDLDEKIREEFGEDCFQDLDEAECREERRWMERENAKLRSKFQKVERQRVLKLVENAERCDPRVRAEKERQRLAREAEKAAKEHQRKEAERLKHEEEERKREQERAAEEARRAEKAKKDEERQVRKAARASLRKQVEGLSLGLVPDQLQEFLLALDPEETQALSSRLKEESDGDIVIEAMKSKGIEVILLKEDERSTAEGSPSDDESDGEAARPAKPPPKPRELTPEERAELERAAAKRAEEKAAREAKKRADQEAADRERRKMDKREAERAKKEEQKREKDVAKAAEKARLEKELNAKRAEEMKAQARLEKEQAAQQMNAEALQVAFERDRLARADAMDRLEWPAVLEAAQAAATAASGALAAVSSDDPEERLDLRLACLGSFFVLGMRVSADSPALSSNLRNRVKKLRERLRKAADKGEFAFEASQGTAADQAALQRALEAAAGLQPPEPQAVAVEAQAPAAKSKKSKAKAAKPEDEDLDALLAELGGDAASSKGKKGKKK